MPKTKEKKDIEKDPPEVSNDRVSSSVRSYFTKDISEQIAAMSVKEMESVLRDIVNDRVWIALLKYTSMRTPLLDATLRGTDPIKDPSKISWAQGAMAGLSDIETYIIDLNTPRTSSEEEQPSGEQIGGVIIG